MKKTNRDYESFILMINEIINDGEFEPMGCIDKEEEIKEKYGMNTTEFLNYTVKLQKMYKKFCK